MDEIIIPAFTGICAAIAVALLHPQPTLRTLFGGFFLVLAICSTPAWPQHERAPAPSSDATGKAQP